MYFRLSKDSFGTRGSARTDQSSCHLLERIAGRVGAEVLLASPLSCASAMLGMRKSSAATTNLIGRRRTRPRPGVLECVRCGLARILNVEGFSFHHRAQNPTWQDRHGKADIAWPTWDVEQYRGEIAYLLSEE